MSSFFIVNEHSRNGRSGRLTRELRSLLDSIGLSYSLAFTESLDHAQALSRKANQEGIDTIVAVGGDGTISKVLNGFFDERGYRISPAKMGAIHTGTSPDFCKSYGIPRPLEGAVQAIWRGKTSLVRAGMIECHSSPDKKITGIPARPLFFGCCANIGLGALLARAANSGIRKYLGDTGGTLAALLLILLRYRPSTVKMTIDGATRTISQVFDIVVGRTRHIASGLKVQHQLEPLDPRLYVMSVRALNLLNFYGVLKTLYTGKKIRANDARLSLVHGARIEITGDTPLEVEFDGDPAGFSPCTITTAPDPLELIVGGSDAG
jgi:diacylglycerol kinase family enzyme